MEEDYNNEIKLLSVEDCLFIELNVTDNRDDDCEVSNEAKYSNKLLSTIRPVLINEKFLEINIKPHNEMFAKYTLIGADDNSIFTEISSMQKDEKYIFSQITPKVITESNNLVEFRVVYAQNSEIKSIIQPIIINRLDTEINVRPHNKMAAIYEVVQPDIYYEKFISTKDSFTRENQSYQTINYGSNSSMMVGRSLTDIWRSFVQFDVSQFNKYYQITKAYLRLYYKGSTPSGKLKLELFENDDLWGEYSITNLNKPNPTTLITNEYTVGLGYIDFDVGSIVSKWINKLKANNGILVRVANETVNEQITFYTRETQFPPELNIEYYNEQVYSNGTSHLVTMIDIVPAGNSEKYSTISVYSAQSYSDMDTEIRVFRNGDPVYSEIYAEVIISKPHIHAEITPLFSAENDVYCTLSVSVYDDDISLSEISVSKPYIYSEIYVSNVGEIFTEITPKPSMNHDVDVTISVNRNYNLLEITPKISEESFTYVEIATTKNSLITELTVKQFNDEDIEIEIEAVRLFTSKNEAVILVTKDIIPLEISIKKPERYDIYTEIKVNNDLIFTEITVRESSIILSEIDVVYSTLIETEITINNGFIHTELSVRGNAESGLNSDIFISYLSELDTLLESKVTSQINSEIDIRSSSQIHTEISLSKENVESLIVVPYIASLNSLTELTPRLLLVDEIYAIIRIGKASGSYVYLL